MDRFEKRRKVMRIIAVFTCFNLLFQTFFPPAAMALTGGPGQPETQSFEPFDTNRMVDPFTGDFVYNIPLIDVGGYPVNLSYHSGIGMDQEASWVGLGWNINAGAITRNMRGLPDDFDGDEIKYTINTLPNKTWGVRLNAGVNTLGVPIKVGLGVSGSLFYNNYRGLGIEYGRSLNVSAVSASGLGLQGNVGISSNSQSGMNIGLGVSVSISSEVNENQRRSKFGLGLGLSANSRQGLSRLTRTLSLSRELLKDKKVSASFGNSISSSIPLGPAYIPYSANDYLSFSTSFDMTVGGEIVGAYPYIGIGGYFSWQGLRYNKKTRSQASYGYLYLDKSATKPRALLDYNRSYNGSFVDVAPEISSSMLTYDMFNTSGQGIAGVFRAYRNDIGNVGSPLTKTIDASNTIEVEIGAGSIFHVGERVSDATGNSFSHIWTSNTSILHDSLGFKGRGGISNANRRALFEPYYFKNMGESGRYEDDYFSDYGGYQAIRLGLKRHSAFDVKLSGKYEGSGNQRFAIGKGRIQSRVKRNQYYQVLNAEEASHYASEDSIRFYVYDFVNNKVSSDMQSLPRYDQNDLIRNKKGHISEIQARREDGWTYVYGIPAYNILQKDVAFAVAPKDGSAPEANCAKGYVYYDPQDAGVNNQKGRDHYYNARELPPFAHSYLLTEIRSPDYNDVRQDGISDDDLGEAVKINYTRVSASYKWRVPFSFRVANYMPMLRSMEIDDRGSYTYGEKEIWYMHEIISRTHVARFYISPREDGHGVVGEEGGISTSSNNTLMKLDSIKLFSRMGNSQKAIKTVHFEYYPAGESLCPGIENSSISGGGKLTLKTVYFTYGKSYKGKYNRYEFRYADYDHDGILDVAYNPSYNLRGYDRWGNYKPNLADSACFNSASALSNVDDPYTVQDSIPSSDADYYDPLRPDRKYADAYAMSWHLTDIEMPSGATLMIDYEADDYAYVQNIRAKQMFKIAALNDTSVYDPVENRLFRSFNAGDVNDYVFFKLEKPVISAQYYEKKFDYFNGIDTLYYKVLVNVSESRQEYVEGWAEVQSTGFSDEQQGKYHYGYLKLKRVGIKSWTNGSKVSPMLKQALQFSRQNLGGIIFPGSDPVGTGDDALKGLLSNVDNALGMLHGIDKILALKGYCRSIESGSSFIRLNNPNYHKKGGGVRVVRTLIKDNWASMVNGDGENAVYGQEYNYEMSEKFADGKVRTISSGVAAFEPGIGAEENPFYRARQFMVKLKMAEDIRMDRPEPTGLQFFPAPLVGYRQVTVRNIPFNNVKRTATGFTRYQYYTSKDFPVIVRKTGLDNSLDYKDAGFSNLFLGSYNILSIARSQGFSVILNDMNGKQKSVMSYDESGKAVSGVRYHYRLNQSDERLLDNEVPILDASASFGNGVLGRETEILNDVDQIDHEYNEQVLNVSFDLFAIGVFPIPIPALIPSKMQDIRLYRIASTTKVIYQYGILERSEAVDFASEIETENLAYDAETGKVILTKTFNEFGDSIFNLQYPAHWVYDEIGQSAINAGAVLDHLDIFNGRMYSNVANGPNLEEVLVSGDELLIRDANDSLLDKLWVLSLNSSGDTAYVIDKDGMVPAALTDVQAKVIGSGRKNQLDMTVFDISTLNHRPDPANNAFAKVLNAEALTLTNRAQYPCFSCDVKSVIDKALITQPVGLEPMQGIEAITPRCCNAIIYEHTSGAADTGRVCDTAEIRKLLDMTVNPGPGVDTSSDPDWFIFKYPRHAVDTVVYLKLDKKCKVPVQTTPVIPPSLPDCDCKAIVGIDTVFLCDSTAPLDFLEALHIDDYNMVDDTSDFVTFVLSDGSHRPKLKISRTCDFLESWMSMTADSSLGMENTPINVPVSKNKTTSLTFRYDENYLEYLKNAQNFSKASVINTSTPLGEYIYTVKTADSIPGGEENWSFNEITTKQASLTLDYQGVQYNMTLSIPDSFKLKSGTTPQQYWQTLKDVGPLTPVANIASREKTFVSSSAYIQARFDCTDSLTCSNYSTLGGLDTTINLFMTSDLYSFHIRKTIAEANSGDTVNPFLYGLRGSWRKHKVFQYHTKRSYSDPGIRTDGVFDKFSPFWLFNAQGAVKVNTHDKDWIPTGVVSKYDEYGREIENIDALGNLSSAIFGYNKTLPVMVSNNARHRETGYEGFEEDFVCGTRHMNIQVMGDSIVKRSKRHAHTGDFSYKLDTATVFLISSYYKPYEYFNGDSTRADKNLKIFEMTSNDCYNKFIIGSHSEKSKYLMSLWVWDTLNSMDTALDVSLDLITSTIGSVALPLIYKTGPIEGWTKYDYLFELPVLAEFSQLSIYINSRKKTSPVYIDDLRIHPFNANARTFVYRKDLAKVEAILDENNFATFYEYDDEGKLIRIKKESERGIMTVQENREHMRSRRP